MPTTPTRTFVATGPGFSEDEVRLDQYLFALSAATRPRVVFLPTASGDADGYVEKFYSYMCDHHDVEPAHLSLFCRDERSVGDHLAGADVVYVGGGNTANMLAVWRLHGVDQALRELYAAGTIMAGISAGVNWAFEQCSTDSFGPLASLNDGLGWLPGSFCPHLHQEEQRVPTYTAAIARGELRDGWGLDDHALAVFTNEQLDHVVATREAGLYRFERTASGECRCTAMPVTMLDT